MKFNPDYIDTLFLFKCWLAFVAGLWFGSTVLADDYIWVVEDPEIQDNIPPSRKEGYEADRARKEAQESLDRIEEEIRRGVDRQP